MTEQSPENNPVLRDETPFMLAGEIEYFDDELALSHLLKGNVLFANEGYGYHDVERKEKSIILYVLCNDIFAWGCADAEPIALGELPDLYRRWQKSGPYGAYAWCCVKRNEKPQNPVVELLKEKGHWTEELEALPDNSYDAYCKERLK